MQFEDHINYNCNIVTDAGTTANVYANWIHNNKLDCWSGWECDAGFNRIHIDEKLNVFGGECLNDAMGNINDGWDMLDAPTICKRDRCTGCTDDLIQFKKERKNVN